MNSPEQSPLGKASPYADQYDASLLFPIARADKRAEIGADGRTPFFGADLWTAYELSWLNPRGKPQHGRGGTESPRTPTERKLDDLEDFSRRLQRDEARRRATGRAPDPGRDW